MERSGQDKGGGWMGWSGSGIFGLWCAGGDSRWPMALGVRRQRLGGSLPPVG